MTDIEAKLKEASETLKETKMLVHCHHSDVVDFEKPHLFKDGCAAHKQIIEIIDSLKEVREALAAQRQK